MLSFKQHVPYHINQEILADLKLDPNTRRDRTLTNKSTMSVTEVFRVIEAHNFEYDVSGFLNLDVTIGGMFYSFDISSSPGAAEVLRTLLEAGKEAGSIYEVVNCEWYFFEKDTLVVDPQYFYRFFLCISDKIIAPCVTISDLFDFPEDFLKEPFEGSCLNDSENRCALTRICYEKWQSETLPGRIYAMKARMEQEEDLAEGGKDKRYSRPEYNIPLILKEVSLVRRNLSSIKGVLWLIALLIGIALLKVMKLL